MSNQYDWITDHLFDHHLGIIVGDTPTHELLQIPGIYEVLREHFNNEVIEACDLAEGHSDWQQEVRDGDTRLDFDEWREHRREALVHNQEGRP